MPISFGTLKRRKQWPIFRTKEAPGLKEYRKRKWLEKQEENRLQSENIERPDKKWVFEVNLMFEVQIIEDLQAPLHIGAGRLPDWLVGLLALDKYADELCSLRCIAVYQGAHRVRNTRKTQAFSTSIKFEDGSTKGIFLWSKIIPGGGLRDMKLTLKEPLRWNIYLHALTRSGGPDGHRQLRRARFVDHEARQSDETLCMCRMSSKTHQSIPFEAACRGLCEWSDHGGVSRRANPAARNCLWKSVLRPQGVCGKGGQLDGTRGPMEGCAYPASNVWPSWGKKNCRISSGWFLSGKKRGVPVPWLSIVFSRTAKGSCRFRKKQSKVGEGWHERCSLQERWIEGGRFLTGVSNWSSVGSMIWEIDHCIRKRKRKLFCLP